MRRVQSMYSRMRIEIGLAALVSIRLTEPERRRRRPGFSNSPGRATLSYHTTSSIQGHPLETSPVESKMIVLLGAGSAARQLESKPIVPRGSARVEHVQ